MNACLGATVLVAEDEPLVCMLIEDELTRAGYEIAGPFPSCAEATHWLTSNTPDLAVLDHSLRDGPCTDVAIELQRRGVPFVTLSAADAEDLPPVMRHAARIAKPDSMERLPALLTKISIRPYAAADALPSG